MHTVNSQTSKIPLESNFPTGVYYYYIHVYEYDIAAIDTVYTLFSFSEFCSVRQFLGEIVSDDLG